MHSLFRFSNIWIIFFFITSAGHLHAQQTQRVYLSGTGADHTKTWDFYCSGGMNSKKWTTIQVPSCWEQQGFGAYNYGHVPFDKRLKESGTYRLDFEVPNQWKGQNINIVFEGVMTDALVKINGKQAGPIHQGAFYQFEYDISSLLKYGKVNQLEVKVDKHSANQSVNMAERKADFWVFGGIFRPVYLDVKPKKHIERVAINATADGVFEADVYWGGGRKGEKLLLTLEESNGNEVGEYWFDLQASPTRIATKLDNVRTWNPEFPNLYKARFSLVAQEKVIHEHEEKFGFRTVEVREQDGIYVNGVRIKFKGVNRHTFHPDYARTSSRALSIEAVLLMKEMNMNAVRMSHYPPEKHFLEVCDSLGMFVLDELTGWQTPAYDETVGRKLVEEMITRDVNHPSIVLWDNGNEGGWNNKLNADFARLDIQKRTVIHPWQDYLATNTKHYIDYDYLSLDGYSKRKIFFPTEVLHGLYDGGHGAGLDDYWLRMWHHPLAAGAFLWVFADEAVARTDRNGALDTDGNHAPDGILGPYMEKEQSFYTIKKIWSPVYIEQRHITPEFNGEFRIENRYHYTNLDQVTFRVQWVRYTDMPASSEKKVLNTQQLSAPLAPGQKGKLHIALPKDWQTAHVLQIDALDNRENTISTWTYPVKSPDKIAAEMDESTSGKLSVREEGEKYVVEAGKLAFAFHKESGWLAGVTKDGVKVPLSNGPYLFNKDNQVQSVSLMQGNNPTDPVRIYAVYGSQKDSVMWKVRNDGRLELDVAYEPQSDAYTAGVSFSYPEQEIKSMRWLGQGPGRVWKNRMQGTQFGVWEKAYNNSMTGHSGYVYPEFKGYHAEVYWLEIGSVKTPGFRIYVKSNDIFFKMLNPEQPQDARSTAVDFPQGELSFLHGIHPVGTKFKNVKKLGPQSSTYDFNPKKIHHRKIRMSLSFDFEL